MREHQEENVPDYQERQSVSCGIECVHALSELVVESVGCLEDKGHCNCEGSCWQNWRYVMFV